MVDKIDEIILITGASGSGKSYICRKMKQMGKNVIDADKLIARHFRLDTKDFVSKEEAKEITKRDPGIITWKWDQNALKAALINFPERPVYIFGSEEDTRRFFTMFDRVYILFVPDDDALRQRLSSRNPNKYYDGSHLLDRIVRFNNINMSCGDYEPNVVLVNSLRSEHEIVADILDTKIRPR